MAGQVQSPFRVGCPRFSFGSAIFDGTTCVSTTPIVSGQTFTVIFTSIGNFKFVCAWFTRIFGSPQTLLGSTRFRVTFTNSGVYPYICALHDNLGRKGTIVVLP